MRRVAILQAFKSLSTGASAGPAYRNRGMFGAAGHGPSHGFDASTDTLLTPNLWLASFALSEMNR